jgi:hypothetical protein
MGFQLSLVGLIAQVQLSKFLFSASKRINGQLPFQQFIKRVVLPLYPNILEAARFNANGKLLCGTAMLKANSCPGQIVANLDRISKRTAFREVH